MQQAQTGSRQWRLIALAAAVGLLWWGRELVWLAAKQLFLGMLTALAALPVMKLLEKRLPAGAAAALAVTALYAAVAAVIFLLVPTLVEQGRQLIALLPGLWNGVAEISAKVQRWLLQRGFAMNAGAQAALLERGQEALGAAIPAVIDRLGGMAGGVGQWLLAPVFGYYFLRDRRMISGWLLMLLPVSWRAKTVRMFREMRRETAGYLRGQLMISAIVGGMTAIGLLFCGVPAWLLLGAVMGILELIPYAGPAAGAVLVALFALPEGWWRTLWALGVVLLVQQADGSVLSPRLLSQTTRLHPAVVILCVVLGGAAAGMAGILLSIPLVLCARAAIRVLVQPPMEKI